MKKALWLALLLPVCASWGGVPLYVKGNIYFLPCNVSTDTKYQEVDFGTFLKSDFQTPGTASEWKTFNLKVENCPPGTTKATVKFDGITDSDDATHFANQAASNPAQNIALQVTNAGHTITYKNQDQMTIDINSGNATGVFPLAARLYSTQGAVTAGRFESVVQLTFTWQ
ncbi:fimbrial protein [Klebsiella indica]|uniref:Type 1 fimbrial protein n=1 Tax=Klebsiella indica TaxID=2582917 RepID=A0A5R9LG48_9ENTR|nr:MULTISPECIES: fimbrial protein [Klebsiella]TLV16075.1 type 1 fimbrial protein [Klebsiella indica]